jgi:hypothetical protein
MYKALASISSTKQKNGKTLMPGSKTKEINISGDGHKCGHFKLSEFLTWNQH